MKRVEGKWRDRRARVPFTLKGFGTRKERAGTVQPGYWGAKNFIPPRKGDGMTKDLHGSTTEHAEVIQRLAAG
jgi:hypothetical protein